MRRRFYGCDGIYGWVFCGSVGVVLVVIVLGWWLWAFILGFGFFDAYKRWLLVCWLLFCERSYLVWISGGVGNRLTGE